MSTGSGSSGVRSAELPIGPAEEREDRDGKADKPRRTKTNAIPRSGSGAEPAADQFNTRTGRHERDEDQLRDRPDQERRQRRRGQLNTLGEPKDPALPLVGHDLLKDGLLGRFGVRPQQHVDGHTRRQQDHRGPQREQAGHASKMRR